LLHSFDMRKLTVVVVVAALFASTAAISVRHQRRWTEKLDPALAHAAEQGNGETVSVAIRVRPGAADRLIAHLSQHGFRPARAATADLLIVQLPASMLRTIAGDPDVVGLSGYSMVARAAVADAMRG
jgi:hypothetical protein